jgi:IS1 family transposase
VDESTPQAVGRWLEPLVKRLGVSVIVTDDLASFRVFDWDKDVPWTNNGTEQSIERMNMHIRTVRGYKSWPGLWAAFMLTGSGVSW